LDEKGGVICYEEYFPYGGTSFIAGDDVRSIRLRDYRHMGKERDAATGLSYFGYRYFASWIFRWVSPDPAGPIDSLNLFLFLKGNPATLYDASGLNAVRRHYNRQLDRHASQEEVREFARKKGICYGEGPVKWKEASGGYWEIKDSWKCDKEPESRLSDRGTGETLEAKRPADPAGPATPARSVPAPVGVVESTPTELAGSTAGIATPVEADPSTVARSEPGGTSAAGSTGAGKPSEPDASAAKSAGESAQGSGTTESGDDRNGNDARSAGPAITGGEKQLLEMLNSNAIGRAITAALRPLGEAVYSFLSGVADFSMGFITSVGEGFAGSVEMAIGAWNMTVREAYDPEGAGKSRERFEKGVKAIVDDPMAIVHGIVDPIAEDWREGRHAMAAGRVFGEVYDTLLGSKGAGKAGKLGKIGKAGKEVSGELAEGAGRKTGRKGARTASELADEGVSTSGGGARPGRGESLVPSQGHQTGDVSLHGNLTPQRNRAPGHHNVREDGFVQSHHPIQDEWARRYAAEHGLPYNSKDAPALLLRSASGEPHAKLSALQRVRRRRAGGWGTTPRAEFQTAYRELLDAGVSRTTARQAINRAYKYFDNLGWFN
ncbi:MAG: hypothetical protein H6711_33455, partial [Myxococcales bacterium]|nr:hypothetical protein [Myxococcales bacterium]